MLTQIKQSEIYSDMPDNRDTRRAVANANDALARAKEEEKRTGKPVPLQLRTNLCKEIQQYDKK